MENKTPLMQLKETLEKKISDLEEINEPNALVGISSCNQIIGMIEALLPKERELFEKVFNDGAAFNGEWDYKYINATEYFNNQFKSE